VSTLRTEFTHRVREITHLWIPLSDGCRLAARIWLPDDAEQTPVPAVFEFIPYRKNDATAVRDAVRHPYVANHGYAMVRVDLRGSGDSEGILTDEYSEQELADAVEVIAWLARQSWCTGKVGMIGISWGGFNGLQVAAQRPPELAGVISVCSTDDRYADDVHYVGGAVLASEMLPWASTMLAWSARPPDPTHVGAGWREQWLERLAQPPFIEIWLAHQRRDAYWQRGSVCEDYTAITCPVYMVGGWGDPYRTAILRFLEHHRGPRKGLIGPWAHLYPELGIPGPAIGFLQEAIRFWDHCLKGVDNGVLEEPMLHAYLADSVEPATGYRHREGRWVAETTWPSPQLEFQTLHLGDRVLGAHPSTPTTHRILGDARAGADAGPYLAFGGEADYAPDQRREDGLSLCFDGAPLTAPVDVLGTPTVTLELSSDQPLAVVAVRLCELRDDGSSLLLTRGLLNLTHRNGHVEPELLEPGRTEVVTVGMSSIGHRLATGSRLRVAISPTYWPWAWPSPRPVTLSIHAAGPSALSLPVRDAGAASLPEAPFGPVELAAAPDILDLPGHPFGQRVHTDPSTGRTEIENFGEFGGGSLHPDGLRVENGYRDLFTLEEHDPRTAAVRCERTIDMKRDDWHARIETVSTMSGDHEDFLVTNTVDAFEHGVRVFARTWDVRIPRDHV
jgi:uncharacterized protein